MNPTNQKNLLNVFGTERESPELKDLELIRNRLFMLID
jgi:hypothetical protein